ncbi:autotransporter-associated beta strand repeat-containing protein [Brucella ceti]|uniref:autotransporter-associated beta strand repeat-containing protein n=1 Tax=Brucella ceti TaxID=120577 RepID=UPI0039B42956
MGEGGAAGSIRTGGRQGTSSQGGAGIIGANIAVINNGTITGGIGGTGGLNAGVQNDAVTFQSGINSLTLTTKSVINGVVSANGNDDTLTLQNTLSKIDGGQSDGANISATQYKGFEHLVVNGGRWTVSGSAIVSGETTLNGGALVVTGPAALGVQAITAQGGAIEAPGDQVLDQSFVLKNNPYGASTSGLVVQGADNLVLSGVLSDVGRLTKNGSGTLTLSGANSYTGATTVSAGILTLTGDNTGGGTTTVDAGAVLQIGTGGTSGNLAGDIANNGALVVNRSDALNLANAISGAGSLMKSGAGTLTLSGANSYTGATTVSAGILTLTGDNTGGGTTTVDAGAVLQIGTGGTSGNLAGDIANNGALVVNRSDALNLANAISGAGSLMKSGAGTLTLSGANSYTGATTVSAGILTLTGDNTGGGTTTVDAGAVLQIGTGGTSGNLAGDIANNGALVVNRSDALNLANAISGAGSLMKSGAGTLTLSGANSYTGATTVSAGILTLTGDNTGGGTTTVDAGAVLQIGTGGTSGNLAGDIANNGALVVNRSDALNLANAISGAGSLMKSGAGTLTLSGANSYTGATTVSAGILTLTGDNTGGGTTTVDAGAVLQIGTGGTSGNLAGDIANNGALVVNRSDALNLANAISGAGSLMKSGAGTLTLSGANSYTGATTVSAGILTLTGDNTGGGTTTVDAGAVLQIGTGGTSGNLAGDIANNGALVVNRSDALNLANAISGAGSLMKSGAGTLTLSGANSYTGATTVSAGILTLTGDNTGGGTTTVDAGAVLQIGTGGTSGNLAGDIANNGALVVNRSDALNLANAISGAGSLMKSGAGTLTLSGANSYTGATTVSAGILTQGAAGGFSTASSRYDVDTDGTLDLGGFDTMLAALYNAGTINMNVGAAGSTLMVNGDYVGHDGTIVFNTVLGDDNSKTDKLMVGGDTAGNTNVQVVNRDGLGAQTVKGIEIITVGGQSNGVFSLVSDYRTKDGQKAVVGGAYAYTLHQGPARGANDGNWYLISQLEDIKPDTPAPRYSANVPVYEGYVQTMQALNKPSTLQERVGKRYMTGENGDGRTSGGMVDAHGIWARIQGAHDRLEPTTLTGMKQEINTFILQAGVDGQFYEDENGKLIAGITGQYGTARSNIVARDGDGRISTNAWSLGATATWIGNDGFYVDTQGQVTWFESDLNSDTADVGLASGRKATGYALSVETGKRIALNGNWALTPQAQLIWSSINADDFEDVWQANISVARGNSFAARFGLAASYDSSWQGSDGRVVNTSVYGITNLYQEFLGGTRVNISGVDFSTDNDRTWAGIGAGGTYAWAGGKYLIFGQGTINTSLDHFADSYAIKGDVGFKVKW